MAPTIKRRRSERLVARVTPDDKTLLERAAALEGCSVATFLLTHSRTAARHIIQRQEMIRLSEEESRTLVKRLLAPHREPTKKMQEALNRYRETVVSDANPVEQQR